MKLKAIVTGLMIAFATSAFADISDYESMHKRLADVLGSRVQADAAYDKLVKEAESYGHWPGQSKRSRMAGGVCSRRAEILQPFRV